MPKRYNATAVMEMMVAITSRLHHAQVSPFREDHFDAWQMRLFALVEEMSEQLDREDGDVNAVTVLTPDMRNYEDLLDEFTMLIKAGIPTWKTLYL